MLLMLTWRRLFFSLPMNCYLYIIIIIIILFVGFFCPQRQVRAAAVSGNLDAPEGGFDALMQAVACQVCFVILWWSMYISALIGFWIFPLLKKKKWDGGDNTRDIWMIDWRYIKKTYIYFLNHVCLFPCVNESMVS